MCNNCNTTTAPTMNTISLNLYICGRSSQDFLQDEMYLPIGTVWCLFLMKCDILKTEWRTVDLKSHW